MMKMVKIWHVFRQISTKTAKELVFVERLDGLSGHHVPRHVELESQCEPEPSLTIKGERSVHILVLVRTDDKPKSHSLIATFFDFSGERKMYAT